MLKLSFLITYGIICVTAAVLKISKHNGKDKSVNLALETVFEFDNDDKKSDINILNKVQKFIGKVKNVIENGNTARRHLNNVNKKIFTTFITDLIQILNQYGDRELENVVSIVSEEMKNHNYAGCKFYELAGNIEQHKVFANKLAQIKNKPAAKIRDDLKAVANKINEDKYSKSEKELLDIINSLYKEDSLRKIHNFLTDIDDHTQKVKDGINITKVINKGLKNILFDHYTNLTIHLRTSLLSKLEDYIKHYKENFVQKTTVTKNNNALRTLRQVYLESDQHDTNTDEDRSEKSKLTDKKQVGSSINHRTLDIYTTSKSKSENSHEILRSPKSERQEKRNRFVKVQRVPSRDQESSSKSKKRSTGTTREHRTWRQMYVEKNIDLKYDADAYEHLTTTKSGKTKRLSIHPFNSPTTRKRNKYTYKRDLPTKYIENRVITNKYRYDDNSDESYKNYHKKDKPDETVLTDFIIDFSSETYKSTTKYRLTKMARHFGQTFVNKDLDYHDDRKPQFRNKIKKLTFKTLYPAFAIDWSTPPRQGKRQFGDIKEFKVRKAKHGGNEGKQLYTYEPGSHGGIKMVKNLDYSIEIKKLKNWEYGVHHKSNAKNSRYKSEHHHKDNPKISGARLHKTARQPSSHVPVIQKQDRESGEGKSKMSRDPMILARQYEVPHHFGRKLFRRQFTRAPMISEEGLSIEGFRDKIHKVSYRRSNNPNFTDSIDRNKFVLKRLQKLEKELELVKIHIKNDTNLINALNYNESNIKNNDNILNLDKHKAMSIEKKTNTDVVTGGDTELKGVNANRPNNDTIESKEGENYVTNKPNSDSNKDFIERKYDDYSYKSQSITTIDSIRKDQGRKAFPYLKKVQENQPDKDQINKQSFDDKNNVKQISEHGSIERNLQESGKKIDVKNEYKESFNVSVDEIVKKKYNSKISQLENATLSNKNETKSDNSWAEVVYKERQFKNKNDENQPKENAIKDSTKPHAVNLEMQTNNSKGFKIENGKDYNSVMFRANDKTTGLPDTTLGADTITNHDNIFKEKGETKDDVIGDVEKTALIAQVPTTNLTTDSKVSDTQAKQLKKDSGGLIDEHANDNVVQSGKKELNTTPLINTKNESLNQNFVNRSNEIASNVTVHVDNKV